MPEPTSGLSGKDRQLVQWAINYAKAGKSSSRPVPTRRRIMSGGSAGNLIRALVNEPGGSSSGVIAFDNPIAYVGTAPTTDLFFNNIHGESFDDNAIVWLGQRKDNLEWEPDRGGGSIGYILASAQVNEVSGVIVSDATFTVDNVTALEGGSSIAATVTVNNQQVGTPQGIALQRNAFADDEWLLIAFDITDGEWYLYAGPRWVDRSGDLEATHTVDWQGSTAKIVNATGKYIFDGNKELYDSTRKFIHATDSPDSFIWYAATNSPSGVGDFDTAGYRFPTGVDFTELPLEDPFNVLTELESGDALYVRLMTSGADWSFVAIGSARGSSGDVIRALVNVGGGVASGTATFAFDGATSIVGNLPPGSTGTAQNIYSQAYVDNEVVILYRRPDTAEWITDRKSGNVIRALVNAGSGVLHTDATFDFDGATIITGDIPTGGTGTAQNIYSQSYADDEVIILFQRADNGQWITERKGSNVRIIKAKVNETGGVLETDASFDFDTGTALVGQVATSGTAYNIWEQCFVDNEDIYLFMADDGQWKVLKMKRYIRVQAVTGSTVSASTASFTVGTVKVIQGDMPPLSSGNLTVYNAAKIPIANAATAEFRWNEYTDHWETEPIVSHSVLGLAVGAVTGGSFTIDNIELVHGSDPRSDPSSASETLSVANPFAWDIDDNGQVLATKKANGTWIGTQAACPA